MEPKYVRWWDLTAILLLWAALGVVSIRLEMTNWTVHLGRVTLLVVIGLWLGVLLGKSRFNDTTVVIFTIIYSLYFVTWQLGLSLGDGIGWQERIYSLGGRLWNTWLTFTSNQPVKDSILFLFSMALLFWTVSFMAGFYLVREARPWPPLIAAAVLFFIVDYYNPTLSHPERYSGIFVLLILLLVGRIYYLQSRQIWIEKSIAVDIDAGRSISSTFLLLGILMVLVAWNFPVFLETLTPGTPARQRFSQSWEGVRERFAKMTSSLQSPVTYVNDFVGDTLSLGPGSVLGKGLVFSAQPSKPSPTGSRYYWRGRSYDTYDKGRWSVAVEERNQMLPDDWPLKYAALNGRQPVDVALQMTNDGMVTAYVPGMPLYLSRPSTLITNRVETNNPEVMSLVMQHVLRSGDVFYSRGWVATPTSNLLEKAGSGYPDWITKRYLQVPLDLLPKYKLLAEEITAGKTTPYDQTVAVTQYLRDHITYQKVIPSPPSGRDPIDWFLFDFKKGYCNYYASAEVLLLRSLGIPARMSAGFAQGTWVESKRAYEVFQEDSHAWPEVYFPGVGWVEFEPTSSQPPLSYPSDLVLSENASSPDSRAESNQFNQRERERLDRMMELGGMSGGMAVPQQIHWEWIGTGVLLVMGIIGVLVWKWKRWTLALRIKPLPVRIRAFFHKRRLPMPGVLKYWANISQMGPMERLYHHGLLLMSIFNRNTSSGQTPSENYHAFIAKVPEADQPARDFLHEIELAVYSQHAFDIRRTRKLLLGILRNGMVKSLSRLTGFVKNITTSRRD